MKKISATLSLTVFEHQGSNYHFHPIFQEWIVPEQLCMILRCQEAREKKSEETSKNEDNSNEV